MKKGELWVVEFPTKKGREQSGKRPAIIMADTKTIAMDLNNSPTKTIAIFEGHKT